MFETFETLSSAGTTLLVPDCELTNLDAADAFYSKQIFYTFLIPIIIILCVVVWSLLPLCCKKLKKHRYDYMILSMVMLTFLCYPTLVKLSLSVSKKSVCHGSTICNVLTFFYNLPLISDASMSKN